ncbi:MULTISPECIES: hypothetical protein [Halomonadaceae]|uniref:Uncharacterized protein n=1 Tax=Vreelandella halophila TaxID=86177 RepID=A0A9X5B541_9GAMM|nr:MULTISPECIES: hypothetical protein [Halomonas]MYL26038.1 hypothetical protein [Halomonas utahensis]MYL73400.1 hypothetical protein [Halomonas sp. 22501_18_FS]
MAFCRFYDGSHCSLQDSEVLGDKKTSGFCWKGDDHAVAIFPEDGTLKLVIDSSKWDLLSEKVDVDYFHDYKTALTTFRVYGDGSEFEVSYPSWWRGREDVEVDEMAASREEENAEEDIFGYVCMLKENRAAADNLYALWARNAAS